MSNLPTIYTIPGLATDHRLFMEYDFSPFEMIPLKWEPFEGVENFEVYAAMLISQIKQDRPIVLLGVSMGGMIAQEIANRIKVEGVILVSSIKTENERSWIIKFTEKFPVYRIMNWAILWFIANTAWISIGVWKKEHRDILKDMIWNTKPSGMIKQTELSVKWHPKLLKVDTYHIHGSKDPLFPIKKVSANYVVKGGNHQMMYKHRKEIQKAAMNWLNRKFLQ